MAKITVYRKKNSIAGLPDTTNVTDPQLRLFLDRIRQTVTELVITVDGLKKFTDTGTLTETLFSNQTFQKKLDKKIDEKNSKNNKKDFNPVVLPTEELLENISVYPSPIEINLYYQETAEANVLYIPSTVDSAQKGVSWSSSDTNIATVDENGKITALAVGECSITATSKFDSSISDAADLTVINEEGEIVTVVADYGWCDGGDNVVFVENEIPASGDFIWLNASNEIFVPGNKTLDEVKKDAAYSTVESVENRDYITVSDGTFFRNAEKDIVVGDGYKRRIRVQTIDILGKDHSYPETADRWKLWIDLGPGIPNLGVGDTRIMYRNAWDTELNDNEYDAPEDQLAKYSVENCLIGESAPWFNCGHFGVKWLYYVYDDNGSERHYGYCLPTGNSVSITNDPDGTMPDHAKGEIVYREHRTYDGKHTFWINDDPYGTFITAYPGKPYWSFDEYSAMWEIKPDTRDDNGRPYHLIRSPFNTQTSVCFEYNGLLYGFGEYMGDHHGAVYELDTLKAWTVSPCAGDETVYTLTDDPAQGDECFYRDESGNQTSAGTISVTGEAVYSITSQTGETFYIHYQ